jgi:hypothetical protein
MPDPTAGRPFGPKPPFDVGNFSDWLHAQILVQEAERLLGKGELHRSKSNKGNELWQQVRTGKHK